MFELVHKETAGGPFWYMLLEQEQTLFKRSAAGFDKVLVVCQIVKA